MTKKQVVDFVRRELECGDSVLSSTAGNGGAGGILVSDPSFPAYLESLVYVGPVEISRKRRVTNKDSTCATVARGRRQHAVTALYFSSHKIDYLFFSHNIGPSCR